MFRRRVAVRQVALLADPVSRRMAVSSLDTATVCLVPNSSRGSALYKCRSLPNAVLEHENQADPGPYCLGGTRSWLACAGGTFLCELRVAEAPVEIPGGGMRCAKSGALEAAERPARVFADVRLSSRMANQMIQYLFASLVADQRRWILRLSRRTHTPSRLDGFPHATFSSAGSKQETSRDVFVTIGCGEYHQNYLYLQSARSLASHLFAVPRVSGDAVLGQNDVVVHFRKLETDVGAGAPDHALHPPPEYFDHVLSSLVAGGGRGAVWVVTEQVLEAHSVVVHLRTKWGCAPRDRSWFADARNQLLQHRNVAFILRSGARRARVHGGTPAEDMALAYRAPHFIGSQGTFSWMVAYLSQGTSVHLPFLSSTCDGAVWLPWSNLFIHDDPRIRYYALEGPLQALTPDEVYPTLCPLRHRAKLAPVKRAK